jgi:transcriptional regulator with PAS, ATPase and Fis domain
MQNKTGSSHFNQTFTTTTTTTNVNVKTNTKTVKKFLDNSQTPLIKNNSKRNYLNYDNDVNNNKLSSSKDKMSRTMINFTENNSNLLNKLKNQQFLSKKEMKKFNF